MFPKSPVAKLFWKCPIHKVCKYGDIPRRRCGNEPRKRCGCGRNVVGNGNAIF